MIDRTSVWNMKKKKINAFKVRLTGGIMREEEIGVIKRGGRGRWNRGGAVGVDETAVKIMRVARRQRRKPRAITRTIIEKKERALYSRSLMRGARGEEFSSSHEGTAPAALQSRITLVRRSNSSSTNYPRDYDRFACNCGGRGGGGGWV